VAYDASSGEWLLGGPAGNIVARTDGQLVHAELKLPPVLLEDLLSVAPLVLQGRGEFGCSIDPVHERLVAATKMVRQPAALRSLRSDPEQWADQWKATLGRQQAKVFGLPGDSPTGFALLVADAHMKRIGLGLEAAPASLRNYWLESDRLGRDSNGGMVRWWFALSDARIPWDPQRKLAHFENSNVRVLSEAQMLNAMGERVVAQGGDPAADAFAKNFTLQFAALQERYPEYGRLRHIFDLAVALEIVRAQIQAGLGKPLTQLGDGSSEPHLPVAPREIDSVVATRRSSDGRVSAIVSGGVTIAPGATRRRLREHVGHSASIPLEASPGDREEVSSPPWEPAFWR
jgi:hypothetical protein